MRITAEPRSDQWNAEDFLSGPRTFTIKQVHPGRAEQKYDIELVEGEGRAWRPPLTMLRVLLAAWGDDAKDWQGRRVTLYLDPTVRFGKEQVGGIRISHLSHIDKPLTVSVTVTRGRRAPYKVEPLVETAPAPSISDQAIENAATVDDLRALWGQATPEQQARIQQRVQELQEATDE